MRPCFFVQTEEAENIQAEKANADRLTCCE